MNSTPAIHAQRLCKIFGDPDTGKVAVAGLDLTVERGEVFGFLGPNGAGKTTSIKMLLGLVRPTSGTATLLGRSPGDPRGREKVGFLPEHFRFHDWLTGREFLRLHAQLYRIPGENARKQIDDLLDLVGLAQHAHKRLRTYSKGMLQRIGLAQALLNDPELVFLDEPTSGLDPVGRRLVRDIIRDLRQRGATVFLNSHLLSEVEITCDRVAFIKHGEVIRVAALQSLVEGELTVQVRTGPLETAVLDGLSRWSRAVQAAGDQLTMTLSSEDDLPAITRYLVESGVEVYAIQPQRISLEDLFIQIVGTDGGL
jgi:ABC-2 type transport system ATP-binding protein